jgi:conjugal transfer mating pair stabilization protein TraN
MTDTYDCVAPGGVNYCAPLDAAGCLVTSSVCTKTDAWGTCEQFTKIYQCGNSIGTPGGTVVLDNTYTIVQDTLDYSACATIDANPACTLAENACIEGPGTRNIDGLDIYKDCWKYEQRYTCSAGVYANYCAPLVAASCVEAVAATCLTTAWNGECIMYERTYNCNAKQGEPLPTNVTYLNSSYTITGDTLNTSACTDMASNPNCTFSGQTCVEGPETRNISGLDVYKACWRYQDDYVCAGTVLTSNCAELQSRPECIETSTPVCVDTLPGGQCGVMEHSYECSIGGGVTTNTTDCSAQQFCVAGSCFDTGYTPDKDFGRAVATMEGLSEAGSHDLFKGEAGFCARRLGGLVNCCKSSSGGADSKNSDIATTLGLTGLRAGAEVVKVYGSEYLFDALYSGGNGVFANYAASVLAGNSIYAGEALGSFSAWGAEFSYSIIDGFTFVGFDPWSLAASIAIHIIMDMASCDEEDQKLAMKKGQDLCYRVGSYCDTKVLGACLTKKEGHCCFPSKLARIVNEQGRPQIGKSWGTPKAPDCSGFSTGQIELLRFDEMNFSEFVASIPVPSGKSATYAIDRLNAKAASYYAPP